MNEATRTSVRGLVHEFLERWIADRIPQTELEQIAQEGISPSGLLAPFHDALVPGITLLGERSFSTRLGRLHERVAAAIAREVHASVEQPLDLTGSIPLLSREFITQRVRQLERRQAQPDAPSERSTILAHFGEETPITTRIDLYIRTREGEDHYFEMKSAKPNKGQCIEMKQRMLSALAIRRTDSARAWWGVPYNPYGLGPYLHAYALPFFDFEHEVMLGEAFWNFVGGSETTSEELLFVYREVGEEFAERLRELHERFR